MSEENRQDLQDLEREARRGLLMRRAIERQVSGLIEAGTAATRKLKEQHGNRRRLEESQFRNLLNVATETQSVDVVTNFIRYQIGRLPDEWGTQEAQFGPTLIRNIEAGAVRQAAVEVRKTLEKEKDLDAASLQEAFLQAYIQLTRLYLGYANRAFYYARRREEKDGPGVWDKLYREDGGDSDAA